MEGFSRLSNYLGNVKAPIMSKIVRVSVEKFLRLAAHRTHGCGNDWRFRAVQCGCTHAHCPAIGPSRARLAQLNNGAPQLRAMRAFSPVRS
jgi:hypothetical protein